MKETTKKALAIFTASALAVSIQNGGFITPSREKPQTVKTELPEKRERTFAHINKVLIDAGILRRRLENFTYTYIYTVKEFEAVGVYYITAYCNCSKCCTYPDQPTASGVFPHYEDNPDTPTTCAIDPRLHSFGEVLCVDGKTYIAEDTGSAVKGRHIDLFFEDHSEVQSFGSHYATVYTVSNHTEERTGQVHEHINNYLHFGSGSRWSRFWNGYRAFCG